MSKERKTESLFESIFKEKNEDGSYNFEYQGSEILEIKRLLSTASKAGTGNYGSPEFIITSPKYPNYVIVVECKSNRDFHKSENCDNPKDYAVDGVMHYAKFISQSYNVIAIAVSGTEDDNLLIDNLFLKKGDSDYIPLVDKYGMGLKTILSFDDYIDLIMYDDELEMKQQKDLLLFSKNLHDFMYSHAKLTEEQKPLLVSGTLIALQKQSFLINYDTYAVDELPEQWLNSIEYQLKQSNISSDKISNMLIPYSQIKNHPEMKRVSKEYPNGILNELILKIKTNLIPIIKKHNGIDIMGQFYGEFLKYTAGDGKGLGIVLTPRHITELFCDLVDLKPTDKVLDLCTGTGGFLISAMDYMIKKAIRQNQDEVNRVEVIKKIKSNGLVGVEQQPHMFTLAASNMILRGDGKSNLYQGSCFNDEIVKKIKEHGCNIGFINPPYSQKDFSELDFINHMLNCLTPGGVGVAIIPMSCSNSQKKNNKIKEKILKNHTLKAAMSMPDKLFYPVGTITQILIFEAHRPHDIDSETWFGYWKDDGFKIKKHNGRKDSGSWEIIKKDWIKKYKSRSVEIGKSAFESINYFDEWACEPFLETNHEIIDDIKYIDEIKKYLSYKFLNNNIFNINFISNESFSSGFEKKLDKWMPYKYSEIFEIVSASNYQNNEAEMADDGCVPFITSSSVNNGCYKFVDLEPKLSANTLSVSKDGSVCYAFYQEIEWAGNGHIYCYNPYYNGFNKYHAFFIIPLINSERYKFNFGRSFKKEIMTDMIIHLPSIYDEYNKKYIPDWDYMENYIKSLPYSKTL